ncbi:MAG: chemotaxis protein CheA [Clostridia bacterium]|nr:chemotaxis protein CheA [Clostridia bacterium]
MMNVDTGLFLDDFEAEARGHIGEIEAAFLDVATLALDHKRIDSIFRNAHSLKGTAGFFALDKIVAVAHALESVFSRIKDGNLIVNEKIADIALQSVDCLKDLVDHMGADEEIDTKPLLDTLQEYTNQTQPAELPGSPIPSSLLISGEIKKSLQNAARRGRKAYYVHVAENAKEMIENITSIGTIVGAVVNGNTDKPLYEAADIISALAGHKTPVLELYVACPLEPGLFAMAIGIDQKHVQLLAKETYSNDLSKAKTEPIYQKATTRKNDFSIRLDVSAINGLLDLANEMILTRNQLLSVVADHKKSIVGLTPILHDMNRLTSEIQEKVMRTRMQPISVIFEKFPRIIRDTAKSLRKDIEIEIFGEDVMLDKYLLDSLTDPITQLVKNAADHGLESPKRRGALGKHKNGKITLNAHLHDGSAIIEVRDDGAGIDMEALKRISLERGLVTEEALLAMPPSDVFALVFEPGISTAKRVTSISGRGVGMDIVKSNIEKLGGSIEIDSALDKGTTVRLKMPLTLSVIRTLIITIDSIAYAVPESNVERIVRIWRATPSRRLETVNNSLVLTLNGQFYPVVTMEEIEAKARGLEPPPIEVLLERARGQDVIKCLVLKAENKDFALLIDNAIETVETLVKPLPLYLQPCLCYSNVTVLGNGNAVTILDAEGILRLMGIETVEAIKMSAPTNETRTNTEGEKQVILFQCSGAEYFALEAGEIARLEVICPQSIQTIGNSHFVNIADETIRVVRPEDYAPVQKQDYTAEKLYILTLKKSASPIGMLAGKVLDKVQQAFVLDHDRVCGDFISGTSVLNEKILIFLNAAAIMNEVEKDKKRKQTVKKRGKAV